MYSALPYLILQGERRRKERRGEGRSGEGRRGRGGMGGERSREDGKRGEERGQSALHKARVHVYIYIEQRVEWNVRRPGNST